jgi:hypothetical protein
VRAANPDDDHLLLIGEIEKFHAVWRMEHAGTTRRLAPHVRIVLRSRALPVLINGPCPRLERNIDNLQISCQIHPRIIKSPGIRRERSAGISFPNAFLARQRTKIHATIG